jgi:predicted MFS family arabinose efflux permease
MRAGLIVLCLAYVLSQFFRAFLAVLSVPLTRDIGVTAEDLATASGLWFLIFAGMQLPVGWALDRIGPRRTAAGLLLIGGSGGALFFAFATAPWQISLAMALIGVGCSPVLMASYYIFAREFPPARFATLAALMLGVGSAGNLVASYPTALAADLIGWRGTMVALAAISAVAALGILLTVRDPDKVFGEQKGSVLDLLKLPAMWAILPMMFVNYTPAAAIRGLWAGPYLSEVFGLSTAQVGQATLLMGAAMIAGTLAYGPLDRVFGSRKWVVFGGNLAGLMALTALVVMIDRNVWVAVGLIAAIGFFCASFPMMMAHGRGFFPPHLIGRGVTLLNLFAIGGVGLMQFASGRVHAGFAGGDPATPYVAIFAFFALSLATGLAIYLLSRDSTD